jgi:hypothetical protein
VGPEPEHREPWAAALNCHLRIPTSLSEADAIIAACSGVADWRPAFVLGLGSAALVVVLVLAVWATLRWVR